MTDWRETNRAWWDERAGPHVDSGRPGVHGVPSLPPAPSLLATAPA